MARKTVVVRELIDFANKQLERTDEVATKSFKEGIYVMLEKALLSSDNYNGFYHLDKDDCDIDTLGHASRKYF